MTRISEVYTPEELRSMAMWDAFCDIVPITADEIREARERDSYAVSERRDNKTKAHNEAAARYREAHREEIRAKSRASDAARKRASRAKKRTEVQA